MARRRTKQQKFTKSRFNRDISNYRNYLEKEITQDVIDNAESVIIKTLEDTAQDVFDVSQGHVPLEDGDLQATGKISEITRNGMTWSVSISYGDGITNYAYFVHEDMPNTASPKTYSKNNTGTRGPKYLERAMDEVVGNKGEKLTARLRDNLKKGK